MKILVININTCSKYICLTYWFENSVHIFVRYTQIPNINRSEIN